MSKESLVMKFTIYQLEQIIVALINHPENKKFSDNTRRLFKLFSPGSYISEYDKEVRVRLIERITEISVEKTIVNKKSLVNFIDTSGKYQDAFQDILSSLFDEEISEDELILLDRKISNLLKFGLISGKAENLSDMLAELQAENYDDLEDFVFDIGEEIESINREIRSARESIENSKYDVSLGDASFVNVVKGIIQDERNPTSKIKTGIKMMTEILDGGFEKGRVYCALGVAGGWKSGFLLNTALWALKYNDLKASKPGLKPVVVYLTMENSIDETIKRIWVHHFGNDSQMGDYEPNEAIQMLEKAGIFTPNKPNKPELVIWHRSNKSINTADMRAMIEDLEKSGKQCVLLIQDYLKRIRPVNKSSELRIELSNISDEFNTIAKELDIPIVTAMQLKFGHYSSNVICEFFLIAGNSLEP